MNAKEFFYRILFKYSIILVNSCTYSLAVENKNNAQEFINSIHSVEQVKMEIRESLHADCGTGACSNFHATRVCDLTAALDVKTGYAITGTFENERSTAKVKITESDLILMKLIFSQCKPSNYQYWNYGQILHVVYDPSPKANSEVNRRLGIKPK